MNAPRFIRYFDEFVVALWMYSFVIATRMMGSEDPRVTIILFALLGAGAAFIVLITARRRVRARVPESLTVAVLIFNVAIVLSYVFNAERYQITFMLGNIASSWLVFLAAYAVATRMEISFRITMIIFSVLTCVLLPMILSQGEMVWGRLVPRDLHPNFVGMIALLCLIGALGFRSKVGGIALSILPLYTMWIVSARTCLLAAFLAAAVTGWIHLRRAARSSAVAITCAVALLTLAFIFVASALLGGPLAQAFDYIGKDVFLINDEHRGLESGGSGRSELWAAALDLWMRSPVFGVGFKGHQLLMPDGMLAHDAYLGMLADTGLCGLLSYLVIIGVSFYHLLTRRDALLDYPQRATIMIPFVVYGVLEPKGFGFGNPYSLIFLFVAFDCCKQHVSGGSMVAGSAHTQANRFGKEAGRRIVPLNRGAHDH